MSLEVSEKIIKELDEAYSLILLTNKIEKLEKQSGVVDMVGPINWPTGEYTRLRITSKPWVRKICELPYIKVVDSILLTPQTRGEATFHTMEQCYEWIVNHWNYTFLPISILRYWYSYSEKKSKVHIQYS